MYLPAEMSVQIYFIIEWFVRLLLTSLYTLVINPLANSNLPMLSPFFTLSLHSFVFFAVQEVFSLLKSHVFIFATFPVLLSLVHNILIYSCVLKHFLYVSPYISVVFVLIFKHFIAFQLVFVFSGRQRGLVTLFM